MYSFLLPLPVIRRIARRSIVYSSRDHTEPTYSTPLTTMRTNNNEINVHLLLANDVDRLRQAGKIGTSDEVRV